MEESLDKESTTNTNTNTITKPTTPEVKKSNESFKKNNHQNRKIPSLTNFETIEVECNNVLNGLVEALSGSSGGTGTGIIDDPKLQLASFRTEYEKLFHALKKSYHQETFLAEKCEQLSAEIQQNASKVQMALQNSQQDQSTIALLKQDSEKAWSLVEAGKQSEEVRSKAMERLQNEVEELSKQLQEERTQAVKQEESLNEAWEERDNLKLSNEDLQLQMDKLDKTKSDLEFYQKENELRMNEMEIMNKDLSDALDAREDDLVNMKKKCEKVELELFNLKSKLEQKTKDYNNLQYSASMAKTKSEELGKELFKANKTMEAQASESSELGRQMQQISKILESQKNKMGEINDELLRTKQELKLALAAQNRLQSEKTQLQRKYDSEHRSTQRLQQAVDDAKAETTKYQRDIQVLQQEFDKANNREDQTLRQLNVIQREKNLQIDKMQHCGQRVKQADEEMLHQEQTIISLEKDLSVAKDENSSLEKRIGYLEKVCTKHSNSLADEKVETEKAREALRLQDIDMKEIRNELRQWEDKAAEHVQTCNKLRADRGKISRQLILSQEEVTKQKDQIGALGNDIRSLRRELASRNEFLVKEHFDKKQAKTQKEQASNAVSKLNKQLNEQDCILQEQESEIRRLNSSLKQMDEDALNQRKEYDQIVNERDILGAQLIRRNDELALMMEQIKIQETTLKKGEVQYHERLSDLRLLAIKIQDMQRELNNARKGSSTLRMRHENQISRELIHRERELLEEKIKVKALSDELENPLNVHRWRKLEGSDPSMFELIQKIEVLQKRLIRKTEEVIEKDAVIQDREHQFSMLKKQRERQPGVEVVEKLSAKETEVRDKQRQMKAMAGELNMNQTQVMVYKKEIDRLNSELLEMKQKFFEQKKKEALYKERELEWLAQSGLMELDSLEEQSDGQNYGAILRSQNHRDILPHNKVRTIRYVGGGFRAIPHVDCNR